MEAPNPAGGFQALRRRAIEGMQAGRLAEAVEFASRALSLHPGAWGMAALRADALAGLGRNEEALRAYDRALALKPDAPKVLFNRGRALAALGRHREALDAYDRVLALKPDNPGALLNRGNALRALGRLEEAMESFRRALALRPRYAQALNNLGNALQALGRYEEAIGHYESALEAQPDYVDALNNRGNALLWLARYREAIEYYDRVLVIQPALAAANWNKGTAMLSLGLSREAWLLYEHRLESDLYDRLPDYGLPVLGSDPVRGRKVLLQWEARFGDIIQMLRYLPALQDAAAACWLQVAPALRELAARSFPQARVVGVNEAGEADCRVPYTSLPLAMGTFSEEAIPRTVPYVVPDPAKVAHWRRAPGGGEGRRIGLAWRGKPVPAHRSIGFEALRPVFDAPGARFVTLQKGLSAEERAALAGMGHVTALDEELASFDDTAAVVAGLDLMISIDSAVAHLAGALGRPTWVLLKLGADWRWMSERDDTPWYPTARLFRQEKLGDWAPVVARVCEELARLPRGEVAEPGGAAAAPPRSP